MLARTSYEKGVCPFVRPSVCQTRHLWRNERKLCQHPYTTWKIIHRSFVTRRMVGGATPSTWNFGSNWPRWTENADFQPIFARSASAEKVAKSSVTTKSTTLFPMSLRWTSYVAPKTPAPKGAQKRKTAVFRVKSHFTWRKSATKFFVWKL